jgi:mannonate dehydratase
MNTVESFERLVDLVPSPMNGITLCQGNFTLMTPDLPQVIRQLGATGKVFFVHFRDVRGTPNAFHETFIDDGQTDMVECLRAYRDIGFQGIMRTDHTPTLAGDTAEVAGYSVLGRLHAIGYLTGIKQAVLGLFEDDLAAQTIVEGDMDGIEGEELRDLTGLDAKAFASKRRLVRRRIDRTYPKGWTS